MIPLKTMTTSSSPGTSNGDEEPLPRWRKLLWVRQPYPDNYVDDTFLSQLKQNSHVQPYTLGALSRDSCGILEHVSSVVLFGCGFYFTYTGDSSSSGTKSGGSGIFGASDSTVLLWVAAFGTSVLGGTSLKSSALVLCTLLALSPVLKSLTLSTSSDSIWALACWLVFANILFKDYSDRSGGGSSTRSVLATNLVLSAAIVLASRLESTIQVFSFILFSIQLFGVFPNFTSRLRSADANGKNGGWLYYAVLLILVVCSSAGLFLVGGIFILLVWIVIMVGIVLGLPVMLLTLQKYKNEIQGPWDPARPILKNN
jgi:phosphatidylinositol glycan class C protein